MPFVKRADSRYGCCRGGNALGQLDEGSITAVGTSFIADPQPGMSLFDLFKVSVGAGITVWAVTKWLSKKT